MKKVLIVWQELPENVSFYLVNANDEQYGHLLQANEHFIGSEVDDDTMHALNYINNAVSTKEEYCYDGDKEMYCIGKDCKVNLPIIDAKIDAIVTCGYYM